MSSRNVDLRVKKQKTVIVKEEDLKIKVIAENSVSSSQQNSKSNFTAKRYGSELSVKIGKENSLKMKYENEDLAVLEIDDYED